MRKSNAEAAETRQRIVETAASEFRRHGIHATGLADLMAAAGLTHGGFYRHFASKDQLVAEACAAAVESVTEKLGETVSRHATSQKSKRTAWQAAAAGYLSTEHRDDPSGGCPFAALGEELARGDDNTRAAATKGFQKLVDFLAEQLRETRPTHAKRRALVALSAMVGAMTMSRMVTDPELSAAILRETKAYLADA